MIKKNKNIGNIEHLASAEGTSISDYYI